MKETIKMGDINLSPAELKQALQRSADGGAAYVGSGDQMLNLGKAESFADESRTDNVFTLTITNKNEKAARIQFNEIISGKLENHGILKEGDLDCESGVMVNCAGDPRSIDILAAYIKKAPIRLRSIKFNVSDPAQLDEPIKYLQETPFRSGVTEQKIPSTFQDQNTNNANMVTVEYDECILGFDSTLLYKIRAGVTVSLTLSFGAAVDTANALRRKYSDARQTAAAFQLSQGK